MNDNRFHVDESKPWFSKEAGWPDEVPKNLELDNRNLYQVFEDAVGKFRNRRAIWFQPLDATMTYGELKDAVDRIATGLDRQGIKKGDVVAMMLPNSFQYVAGYYACARIGAIASGVNPTYKPGEILHQLKTVGAKVFIVLDALYEEQVAPIFDESPCELLITTNIVDMVRGSGFKKFLGKLLGKIPSGNVPATAVPFKDLLASPPSPPDVTVLPDDIATYIMTGGTTGVPKAAVLTHFNCVNNAKQCRLWIYKVSPGSANVGVLPLFHSFAMTTVMNSSLGYGGWMMLFPRPPETEILVQKIIEIGPPEGTIYCGAEILFQRLTDFMEDSAAKERYGNDLAGKLTLCISGAGPLHRPVQEAFEKHTNARLSEGFGLTEATPVVSCSPFWGERKIGTIGLPFPGTDWKIVDKVDYKTDLGIGEEAVGELALAGPQVMKGYLNKPDETAETVVEMDGKMWLLTGDIGFMDEHGRVIIRDRKKQLIKYKGYSVFPKEVEELLAGHPAVSEVAVAGLPDEKSGEVIKAWVVLRNDKKGSIAEKELLTWAKDNMTHYKVPNFIEFRDEIPKSLIGKVLRRELQEADPIWIAAKEK
ncbi:MAG: long-chain fatty acid--CoA ligase [Deltaproteobacteria bacterium]|nr:long-chain fatty acid--CoA ligase [Deltaproteobacteria bacterium]